MGMGGKFCRHVQNQTKDHRGRQPVGKVQEL